jgi:hypothetical protein
VLLLLVANLINLGADLGAMGAALNPDNSVRPEGAGHQWRKVPPGELSVSSGS